MKKIYSWQDYEGLIEDLAKKLITAHNNNLPYDQLLCLARGGVFLGDAFSRIFSIPLAILFTSSYKSDMTQGEIYVDDKIANQSPTLGSKILLLDDLVDSGKTIQKVIDRLYSHHNASLVDSAVLWKKECSSFNPTYYSCLSPSDQWIVQPFEKFEDFKK